MMSSESLRTWANQVVADQPLPPRRVPLWPLIRLRYVRESTRYLLALGLIGAAAFTAFSLAPDDGPWRMLGLALTAGLVGWAVLRPTFAAVRLRHSLSFGTRATAIVMDVAYTAPHDAGESIESLRNGTATGRWRVEDGLSHVFVASFATDAPWAAVLRPGSVVEVLIDDGKLIWELGLVER